MDNSNHELDLNTDLNDIKIRHNQDDFIEGQNYILTMKDQSVLRDGDVNDDEDEMENVELEAVRNLQQLKNAKAKVKRGNNLGYDTTEYADDGTIKKRAILDKYDQEELETTGMILNLKNNTLKKSKKILNNSEKFERGERNEMSTKKHKINDYLDTLGENDTLVFNDAGKSKKFKKGKKRDNKNKRKILADELENLLNDGAETDQPNDDLKSRDQLYEEYERQAQAEQEINQQKLQNYEKATTKAVLKTNRMLNITSIEDDDYDIIQKSLERQRKQMEAKRSEEKQSSNTNMAVEQKLLSLLNESIEESKKSEEPEFAMPMSRAPLKGKFSFSHTHNLENQKLITDISQLSKDNIETEQDRQDFAQIL